LRNLADNDFLSVSHLSVSGAFSINRPNLVGFVNGLTLVVKAIHLRALLARSPL
jgi:type I site-specific restriction-modification system R (restriction) subunit